jgi:hypothetical protein
MAEYHYWTVDIYSSGSTWVPDTPIRVPNDNLTLGVTSTQAKLILADGSNSFVNPEVKYTKDVLNFIWMEDDGTLKTQIEDYIKNGDYLRITTHTSEEFIGRFLTVSNVWLKGVDDTYDVSATFERME